MLPPPPPPSDPTTALWHLLLPLLQKVLLPPLGKCVNLVIGILSTFVNSFLQFRTVLVLISSAFALNIELKQLLHLSAPVLKNLLHSMGPFRLQYVTQLCDI